MERKNDTCTSLILWNEKKHYTSQILHHESLNWFKYKFVIQTIKYLKTHKL